jgi:hypothetical protein
LRVFWYGYLQNVFLPDFYHELGYETIESCLLEIIRIIPPGHWALAYPGHKSNDSLRQQRIPDANE